MRIERETTIVFNDEENNAKVWSCSAIFQRRMAKLGIAPERTAPREGADLSCWYTVPKKWVKIRLPVKRIFDEEQKKRIADATRMRFKAARESKQQASETLSPEE